MISATQNTIRRRAVRIRQNQEHPLFLFSLRAHEILEVAQVSRIGRDRSGSLIGYQRPEVRKHIKDITDYLDSQGAVFPNSIILAFDSTVTFTRSRGRQTGESVGEAGVLTIPLRSPPPGWIVDGQQRAVALAKMRDQNFPVPVNAFIADDLSLQRDQFLRVNNTKPLPRGLITELLPEVDTTLPRRMSVRRLPSSLVEILNVDPDSPFKGLIRRSSTPQEARHTAVVTDNSLIQAIEESLTSPSGCLYSFCNLATGENDTEDIRQVLLIYWTAVRDTFPDAWGKPPQKSRLMHGAGIRAMGRVMDRVMGSVYHRSRQCEKQVRDALDPLKMLCRWTSGNWEAMDNVPWNKVENTPRHINLLSSVLVRAVVARGTER